MFENELKDYLKTLGASLVGFADLSEVDTSLFNNMKYGIALGIKLETKIIEGIKEGPTKEYYEEYEKVNKELDNTTISAVKFIENKGYKAIGQTSTYVTNDDNLATVLPHKTVATRAGLGWIGKNALLITPEYGSAIRISSVITDMPLITAEPINESRCGNCTNCVKACPGTAIRGSLWTKALHREALVDAYKCRAKARELSKEKINIEISICGKCIEVCPVTKRYLKAKADSKG